MERFLFDNYGRVRGALMRDYLDKSVNAHLQEYIGDADEVPGSVILKIIYQVSHEIADTFKVDFDTIFHELTELMDATIWADLPGGINDPARKTDPFGGHIQ